MAGYVAVNFGLIDICCWRFEFRTLFACFLGVASLAFLGSRFWCSHAWLVICGVL